MKVYIVIELLKDDVPNIVGVFKSEQDANKTLTAPDRKGWRNVIVKQVQ